MRPSSFVQTISAKRLLIVFGTRPEALKCFPVAHAALKSSRLRNSNLCHCQHREMLDQVMELTGLPVHYDLDIMRLAKRWST